MTRRRLLVLPVACAALLLSGVLSLSAQSNEAIDLSALQRIKEEGFDRSKVMDTVWWLTDMYGPRLTNSPQMRNAADWAVKKMNEWGLVNVKQEPWGTEFGRGWSNQRTVLVVTKPEPWPVIAYAKSWTPGTGGPVTADAVLAPLTTEADLATFKGKLKGKIVLLQRPREVSLLWTAPATRFTDQQLDQMQEQPMPRAGGPGRGGFNQGGPGALTTAKRNEFLVAEGVAAVLEPGAGMGDSGSVLVASGGSRNLKDPPVPTQRKSTCAARSTTRTSACSTSSVKFRAPTRPTRSS
jgi:hypothetical protein